MYNYGLEAASGRIRGDFLIDLNLMQGEDGSDDNLHIFLKPDILCTTSHAPAVLQGGKDILNQALMLEHQKSSGDLFSSICNSTISWSSSSSSSSSTFVGLSLLKPESAL